MTQRRGGDRLPGAQAELAAFLHAWRCPRLQAPLSELGLLDAWGVRRVGRGRLEAWVRLRFMANSCLLLAITGGLASTLARAVRGCDGARVEVNVERSWAGTDLSDAARLELGL